MNLSKYGQTTRVMTPVAAGQATNLATVVDTQGFSSSCFYVLISTIAATGVVTCKVQGSANQSSSPDDFTDLEGTALAYGASDDDKVAIIEIDSPSYRYLRLVVTTTVANGTIDGAICIQHKGGVEPVSHGASVVSAEYHLSPGAGVA